MTYQERLRDAAYASNIDPSFDGVIGGYLRHVDPFHAWPAADWARFPDHRKLPIIADSVTGSPVQDAFVCLQDLYDLGARRGCVVALDVETLQEPAYVAKFGSVFHYFGYHVWVYGSASTVFANPPLDGYWVADYAGKGPFMFDHPEVRATQYASPSTGSGGQWDSSTVKWWQWENAPWWR